ncbi:MAG: hypothetical protein V2I39_07210 [Erythrobacter sp.]|jgi:hypothetical protein|nr:hypothetical protein [Erythrobacter sp.]
MATRPIEEGVGRSFPVRIEADARFVRAVGWILLAITFGAFAKSYFVPLATGEFEAANVWMHPHAVVSFAFAGLFIAQPWLVLRKDWRWHRLVGWAIGLFVLGAVVSGIGVQLGMWPTVPEDTQNRVPAAFRMFQLLPTLALFFTAGVLMRRRPDWHWRLMVHAAYAPMGTALGRFVRMIPDPPLGGPGQFLSFLLLLGILALVASDRVRYGRVHPANWLGLAFYVATIPLSLYVSGTAWYEALSLGPNAR